jgi:hypothetical protein
MHMADLPSNPVSGPSRRIYPELTFRCQPQDTFLVRPANRRNHGSCTPCDEEMSIADRSEHISEFGQRSILSDRSGHDFVESMKAKLVASMRSGDWPSLLAVLSRASSAIVLAGNGVYSSTPKPAGQFTQIKRQKLS